MLTLYHRFLLLLTLLCISLWWVVVGIVNGGLPPFIRVELQVIRAKIITFQLCRPVMAMDLVGDGVMGIPCLTYYISIDGIGEGSIGNHHYGRHIQGCHNGGHVWYYAFIRGRVFNYVSSCGSCVGGSDGDSAVCADTTKLINTSRKTLLAFRPSFIG